MAYIDDYCMSLWQQYIIGVKKYGNMQYLSFIYIKYLSVCGYVKSFMYICLP